MVKFAAYILVLVIVAIVSRRLDQSGLYITTLLAILFSVAGMLLFPAVQPLAESVVGGVRSRARYGPEKEPEEVNPERIQDILTREPAKFAVAAASPVIAPAEPVVPAFQTPPDEAMGEGFEELIKQFSRNAVYAFRAYPPHRESHGRSKIGGCPDLPKGVAWPTAPGHLDQVKEGLPLHFLAQLDLSELAWRPKGFPETGRLLFFGRFDEMLDWAASEADPDNDMRVIFDPDCSGVPTTPPKNLPPLGSGKYQFDLLFGLPGDEKSRTFPEWPLKFAEVETMPEGEDLPFPAPEGYNISLKEHLTAQLQGVLGVWSVKDTKACGFQMFEELTGGDGDESPALALRPFADTGFPFAPRGISLVCRILRNRHAEKLQETMFDTCFEDWQLQADAAGETALDANMANAFVEDMNDFLMKSADKRYGPYLKADLERALYRLVTEAGSSPALAAKLPDWLYLAASDRHPVLLRDADGLKMPQMPDARAALCYHQLFGHLASREASLPLDGPDLLLFQLFSDLGAEFTIGDGGEFDFAIAGPDVSNRDFSKVKAICC